MTELVNLTPHPLHVVLDDGSVLEIPVGGRAPRCEEEHRNLGKYPITVAEQHIRLPVHEVRYGMPDYLPPRSEDVLFVVSKLIADACPDRRDFLFPTEMVRASDGKVIGCRAFGRVPA